MKNQRFKLAKFLIIIGFLIQETSIVFFLFPHEVHFNLYYYIVAPITFFAYDYDNTAERRLIYLFTGTAIGLFLLSEMNLNIPFAYNPSDEVIRLFTWISAVTSILSITIVFQIFAKELSNVHRELSQLANTDGLTQIFNRRFLFKLGKEQFHLSAKYERTFALIIMDVDYFKHINDTYGHPTGDSVLIQLVDLIRGQIRKGDVFSRYGGEEFAVLLKNTDLEDGIKSAEKIRTSIEQNGFTSCDGEALKVTMSAGVVQCTDAYDSFENMVQAVDKALYTAKENGRNCVVSVEN